MGSYARKKNIIAVKRGFLDDPSFTLMSVWKSNIATWYVEDHLVECFPRNLSDFLIEGSVLHDTDGILGVTSISLIAIFLCKRTGGI